MLNASGVLWAVILASAPASGADALWDVAEVRKAPLDVERLSSRKAPLFTQGANDWVRQGDSWVAPSGGAGGGAWKPGADEQLLVEEIYFTAGTTPDGPNRIFCGLARPEGALGRVPVLLVFHGGGGHGSGALAVAVARNHPGCAALAMDYNGQFAPGAERATLWRSVTAELRAPRLQLVPDRRNAPLYHYVVAARRALDLLAEQPWADASRVGCVGISYGGWVALVLAGVDDRVKCVVTAVSAGGTEGTAGRAAQALRWDPPEQRALWLATYDPIAYASRTRAAVFVNLGSNDRFFWLSGAARHLRALAGEKGWLVRPNCDHNAGGPALPDPTPAWVRHVLSGGEALPSVVEGSIHLEGRTATWRTAGPHPIARATLYWSPGKVVSCARYWLGIPATDAGGIWRAELPAAHAGLAGEAFVTVVDAKERAASSLPVSRGGLDPQGEPGPLWDAGSLWDAARGADAWRPLTPGGAPKTRIAAAPRGVSLGPEEGGKAFCALTNSVVLGSGQAARHRGIRLVVDGAGHAGRLTASLVRDSTSLDEVSYAATVEYSPGRTVVEIPWAGLKPSKPDAPSDPWPFGGLRLEGAREGGTALVVEAVSFAR